MIKAAKNVFKADHECPIIPLEPRKDQGNEIAIVACGDFTAPRQRFQKVRNTWQPAFCQPWMNSTIVIH